MRNTHDDTARRVMSSSNGRATLREVDDNHLCQECKQGDTGFSRTHTDFEMWHPTGMTSVPMKQKDDQQQQGQQGQQGGGDGQGGGQDGQWNKKQPKGEAAEAMVIYVNGSAAHPVGMSNDRRVRPYDMDPGEAGLYSCDGSGQIVYHRTRGDSSDGLYLVTCDDQGGSLRADGSAQKQQARYVSVRHANKKKQSRKPKKRGAGAKIGPTHVLHADGQQEERYKHEGDSVNTETRYMNQEIKHFDSDKTVGGYNRGGSVWIHHIPGDRGTSTRADKDHSHIKQGGAHCWMQGGCFHSVPWVIKPDPCT